MSERHDLYDLHQIRKEKEQHQRLSNALTNPIPLQTVYTTQMEHLRENVRKDPNHFYTYSEKYMSLSVDPYTEKEKLKQEEQYKRSKFVTKEGFQNILKREPDHYNKPHKTIPAAESEVMKKYPYHEDHTHTIAMLNPKENLDKVQFRKYLPRLKNGVFNKVTALDEEKLSAVQVQNREAEKKTKVKEEFNKKMVVDDPNFHVGLKPVGVHTLDKYRGLIDEEIKKKSLRVPAKYIQNKIVKRDEVVQNAPISFNLDEAKYSKADIEKLIMLDRKFNQKKAVHESDFDRIKVQGAPSFMYKPSRFDAFTDKYT